MSLLFLVQFALSLHTWFSFIDNTTMYMVICLRTTQSIVTFKMHIFQVVSQSMNGSLINVPSHDSRWWCFSMGCVWNMENGVTEAFSAMPAKNLQNELFQLESGGREGELHCLHYPSHCKQEDMIPHILLMTVSFLFLFSSVASCGFPPFVYPFHYSLNHIFIQLIMSLWSKL